MGTEVGARIFPFAMFLGKKGSPHICLKLGKLHDPQLLLHSKSAHFFQEMWYSSSLVGAPDLWGRGPGIAHNDPDSLQDHCKIM